MITLIVIGWIGFLAGLFFASLLNAARDSR
jgi:hypothetical protein